MSQDFDFTAFIQYCRNKAVTMRDNAGFSGGWTDGGARDLEHSIDCFEAGLNRAVPAPLQKYMADFMRENDPEWAELKRLSTKFGIKVE